MLALQLFESAACSGCGGYLAETTDPDAEERFRAVAARCHACTAIAQEADGYQEAKHPQALLYRVERR